MLLGPIIEPSPGPTFEIEVAAPEIEVIKSSPVRESNAAIKKNMICRTKSDIELDLSEDWNKFDEDVLVISSVTGDGLNALVAAIASSLDQ